MMRYGFVAMMMAVALVSLVSVEAYVWQSGPADTFARDRMACMSTGPDMMVAGGFSGASTLGHVAMIHNVTGPYEEWPYYYHPRSMSTSAQYLAGAATSRYIVFGGGLNGGSRMTPLVYAYCYDTLTNTYVPDPVFGSQYHYMSDTGRDSLVAVAVGQYVVFAGGGVNSYGVDTVDLFDTSVTSFIDRTYDSYHGRYWSNHHLSERRTDLAGAGARGFAFFGGGSDNGPVRVSAAVGTSLPDHFPLHELLPPPRDPILMDATFSFCCLYVVFCCTLLSLDVFDSSTKTWLTPLTLSVARSALKAASAGDRYIVFTGGLLESSYPTTPITQRCDIFDTDTWSWLPVSTQPGYWRNAMMAFSIGDYAVFAGGSYFGTVVDVWSARTRSWSMAGSLTLGRVEGCAMTYNPVSGASIGVVVGGQYSNDWPKVTGAVDFWMPSCPSETNPCSNGQICFEAPVGYTCECPLGFTGDQCQTDIDECASNPCMNGATCVDVANAFQCTCVPGYGGKRCEYDINGM